jgi:hypothetical protein
MSQLTKKIVAIRSLEASSDNENITIKFILNTREEIRLIFDFEIGFMVDNPHTYALRIIETDNSRDLIFRFMSGSSFLTQQFKAQFENLILSTDCDHVFNIYLPNLDLFPSREYRKKVFERLYSKLLNILSRGSINEYIYFDVFLWRDLCFFGNPDPDLLNKFQEHRRRIAIQNTEVLQPAPIPYVSTSSVSKPLGIQLLDTEGGSQIIELIKRHEQLGLTQDLMFNKEFQDLIDVVIHEIPHDPFNLNNQKGIYDKSTVRNLIEKTKAISPLTRNPIKQIRRDDTKKQQIIRKLEKNLEIHEQLIKKYIDTGITQQELLQFKKLPISDKQRFLKKKRQISKDQQRMLQQSLDFYADQQYRPNKRTKTI